MYFLNILKKFLSMVLTVISSVLPVGSLKACTVNESAQILAARDDNKRTKKESAFRKSLIYLSGTFAVLSLICCGLFCREVQAATYNINLVVIGDEKAGKTELIKSLTKMDEPQAKKRGIDVSSAQYQDHGNNYNVSYFDINIKLEEFESGQSCAALENCHYALIVCDITQGTDDEILGKFERWRKIVKRRQPVCGTIFILNKIDVPECADRWKALAECIAEYSGECDRERARIHPETHQDYESIPISAKEGTNLEYIKKSIFEWGEDRVKDFKKNAWSSLCIIL
jgi:GTPase SAR1 family protein